MLLHGLTMTQHKLPNGDHTEKPWEYLAAWEAIGNPIANYLGAKFIGCSRDLTFRFDGNTFSIPGEVAVRFARLIHAAAEAHATLASHPESQEADQETTPCPSGKTQISSQTQRLRIHGSEA